MEVHKELEVPVDSAGTMQPLLENVETRGRRSLEGVANALVHLRFPVGGLNSSNPISSDSHSMLGDRLPHRTPGLEGALKRHAEQVGFTRPRARYQSPS